MDTKISEAIARFRELNALDPNKIDDGGTMQPKELVHADRLSVWLEKVAPQASTALRLAGHSQHLMRWKSPRSHYPDGRVGYLKWRKDLMKIQADRATEVLESLGLEKTLIDDLRRIHLKQNLKTNPDSQAMEDALCLSFLEHDLETFAQKYDDQKVIDILQKTWKKMSPRGHSLALALPLRGPTKELVGRALS